MPTRKYRLLSYANHTMWYSLAMNILSQQYQSAINMLGLRRCCQDAVPRSSAMGHHHAINMLYNVLNELELFADILRLA